MAAKPGLATGTKINANASIVFDKNAPIATKTWTNVVDDSAPAATVKALPASEARPFKVSWSGTTPGSAIRSYRVYVATNTGNYKLWKSSTRATSAIYHGKTDHRYAFVAIATDKLGNAQPFPKHAQASTVVGHRPRVSKLSPKSGPRRGGHAHVLIRGDWFAKVSRVEFGSRRAKFRVVSSHLIRAVSAHGKGTVTVQGHSLWWARRPTPSGPDSGIPSAVAAPRS